MRTYLIFILAVLLHFIPSISHSSERHALVIGNSSYEVYDLKNPVNDATDMAAQLQSMGYKIYRNGAMLDMDRSSMERALDDFAQSLPFGANAVFYYAGHGMATERDNYLIPISSTLEFQSQLKDRTVGLRSIVELLKSYNSDGTNVLLLDACRNNPLTRSFRGMQQGLQKLKNVPRGVFIGYAAESGQVANDNASAKNGTYTGQLLESMAAQPNISIEALHDQVANSVYETTNGAQFPVSEDRIYGSWCFVECGTSGTTTSNQYQPEPEQPPIEISIEPTRNYWKVAGGIALGIAVIALATADDTEPDTVGMTLTPPE